MADDTATHAVQLPAVTEYPPLFVKSMVCVDVPVESIPMRVVGWARTALDIPTASHIPADAQAAPRAIRIPHRGLRFMGPLRP
jgi:hypothetical protein